jgi:hypothetical protein
MSRESAASHPGETLTASALILLVFSAGTEPLPRDVWSSGRGVLQRGLGGESKDPIKLGWAGL